jgi:hypothetical protein
MMLYRISIAMMFAYSGVVSAANPSQTGALTGTGVAGNQSSVNQYAYRDSLNGFIVDKAGKVDFSTIDRKTAAIVTTDGAGTFFPGNNYVYDTPTGNSRINLIERQGSDSKSAQTAADGKFTIQETYGQTMWLPPNSFVPNGWGTISGNVGGWLQVKYLIGAPYGAVEFLNSALPVPGGWGRTNGSYGYGTFKCLNGATYGRQEIIDSSYGIPFNWVRTNPGNGGYYGVFLYVLGAPFGAEIWADSYFPIPNNWVRVSTGGAGYGQFRNTSGAPSGTQWYVDASWGIPGGWTYVGSGYPMCLARKI